MGQENKVVNERLSLLFNKYFYHYLCHMKNYTILLDNFKDELGKYEIKFHNQSVMYNDVEYKYYSSGLCRIVYIDPDYKFVLKIPNHDLYDDHLYNFNPLDKLSWHELPWSVRHNFLEFWAYEQCPDDLKHWFAKTELIDHGWLKQEFVKVVEINYHHNFREIGQKFDDQYCLFDFDPLIDPDDMPIPTWNRQSYERIKKIIEANIPDKS